MRSISVCEDTDRGDKIYLQPGIRFQLPQSMVCVPTDHSLYALNLCLFRSVKTQTEEGNVFFRSVRTQTEGDKIYLQPSIRFQPIL